MEWLLDKVTVGGLEGAMGARWFYIVLAVLSFVNLYLAIFYNLNGAVDFWWIEDNIGLDDIVYMLILFPIVFVLLAPFLRLLVPSFVIAWFLSLSSRSDEHKYITDPEYVKASTLLTFAVCKGNDLAYARYEKHVDDVKKTKLTSRVADGILLCLLASILFSPGSSAVFPMPSSDLPIGLEGKIAELVYNSALILTYLLSFLSILSYSYRDRLIDNYVHLPELAAVIKDEMKFEELQSEDARRNPSIPPARLPHKAKPTDA